MSAEVQLIEGHYAPDFALDTDGSDKVILSSYRGKKNIVLYFYPKDDTPGCTLEAHNFKDKISQFDRLDTVIIGISKDPVSSHDKFKAKHCLPFTLGSDTNSTVCEAYGVWVEKSMYGKTYMGVQRDTFLLDKTGKIRKIWRRVKVEGHCEEVLEVIKSIRN